MRYSLAIVLSCVALVGFTACEQKGTTTQPTGRPRVALIMKAGTNPFFAKMEAGARRAADKLNVELYVLTLDRETDYEKQAAHVEAAVAKGVQAIVITPADSKALVAPLRRAQDEGILIINLDNRIDAATAKQAGLKPLTFIGPDNAAGAEKATRELIRLLDGKGKIAMLEGVQGADNAKQRLAGFRRAVADYPEIKVLDTVVADWDISQGQQKMAALLVRFPELDGVFCANDNMALGAIQAIESAGRTGKIRITAFDNLAAAQAAIRAGKLDATIEQHPDLMGQYGVETAVKALHGEPIEKEIPVPTDLITSATLGAAR